MENDDAFLRLLSQNNTKLNNRGWGLLDTGIISAFISAVGAIGVAYVGMHQRKEKTVNDKREAMKSEGALIQMEMTQAGLKLSKVTAKAVMEQKLNGDVEEAWAWVKRVEVKYADYMRRMAQTV